MSSLTVALINDSNGESAGLVESLAANPVVSSIILAGTSSAHPASFSPSARAKTVQLKTEILSGAGVLKILHATRSDYLMLLLPGESVRVTGGPAQGSGLERIVGAAADSGVGLLYSDYYESARN